MSELQIGMGIVVVVGVGFVVWSAWWLAGLSWRR